MMGHLQMGSRSVSSNAKKCQLGSAVGRVKWKDVCKVHSSCLAAGAAYVLVLVTHCEPGFRPARGVCPEADFAGSF